MPSIIISDTSSLILFDKIGELDLLFKLYDKVINLRVSENVIDELLRLNNENA